MIFSDLNFTSRYILVTWGVCVNTKSVLIHFFLSFASSSLKIIVQVETYSFNQGFWVSFPRSEVLIQFL